ncbi:hypothetical protein ACTFIW_006736 [Dictyostelium discoideum]
MFSSTNSSTSTSTTPSNSVPNSIGYISSISPPSQQQLQQLSQISQNQSQNNNNNNNQQQQQSFSFIEKLNSKTGSVPKLNLCRISNNIMSISTNSTTTPTTTNNLTQTPTTTNFSTQNTPMSLNIIPGQNSPTSNNNFNNIINNSSSNNNSVQNTPTSSTSSRRLKIYKDFCLKYGSLQTVHLRLNTPQELVSISEALKQRHSIVHLNLSHNKSIKELESWIALGLALKAPNQTLSQLNLSHNSLGTEGLSLIISDIIKTNRSITWLNLSHNNLDQDDDHSIMDALLYNQTIQTLDLSNNEYQLTLDISNRLNSFIENCQSITHLNFSRNSNRHPLSGISRALQINQSLRHIDLSFMAIAPQESNELIKTLIGSRFLTSINLQQTLLSTVGETFGISIVNSLAKRYNDYDLDEEDGCLSFVDSKSSTTITTNTNATTIPLDPNSQNTSANSICFTPSCSFSSSKSSLEDDEFYIAPHNPILNLNLDGINFGKKALKSFLNILARNQDLTELDLSSSQLCESNGTYLADFIKRNNSIQTLSISNNDFYEKAVDIAESLQYNKSITSFNLSHTKCSNLIGRVLAKSLCINHTLKKLILSHTKISCAGIVEFAQGLKENKIQLESLNLDDTDLQDKGATEIGEAIRSNTHLTHLYLNSNSILSSGAKSIGKALKNNSTLKVLHLGYNEIGVKGLDSISKSLKTNKTLIELSVKNNLIPEKGGIVLTDSLKSNQKLETINLRGNFLGIKGGAAISKLLTTNQTLTNMDLSHNNLDKDVIHKIHQLLKKNQITNSTNLTAQTNHQLQMQYQTQIQQMYGNVPASSSSSSSSINGSSDDIPSSPKSQLHSSLGSSKSSIFESDGGVISSTDYYFVELNNNAGVGGGGGGSGCGSGDTPTTVPTNIHHNNSFYGGHNIPCTYRPGTGSSNNSPTTNNVPFYPFGNVSMSSPSTPRGFPTTPNSINTPTAIRFPSQSNLPITPRAQYQQQYIQYHQQLQLQQQQQQQQNQQLQKQLQQLEQQQQFQQLLPSSSSSSQSTKVITQGGSMKSPTSSSAKPSLFYIPFEQKQQQLQQQQQQQQLLQQQQLQQQN